MRRSDAPNACNGHINGIYESEPEEEHSTTALYYYLSSQMLLSGVRIRIFQQYHQLEMALSLTWHCANAKYITECAESIIDQRLSAWIIALDYIGCLYARDQGAHWWPW